MKKCPFCAEDIQDEAIICRYCGRELEVAPDSRPALLESPSKNTLWLALAAVGIIAATVLVYGLLRDPVGTLPTMPDPREEELNEARATELVRQKIQSNLNALANYSAEFVRTMASAGGVAPASVVEPRYQQDWSVSKNGSGEYVVTVGIKVICPSDPAGWCTGFLDVINTDLRNLCPGNKAEFTVLLESSSVLPTNSCAENISY